MKKNHLFSLPINTLNINQSIVDYFTIHGFKVKDRQQNKLHFSKGSAILNLLGFDPFSQCSEVIIIRKENQIYSYALISTIANRITTKEEIKWNNLFSKLEETLSAVIRKSDNVKANSVV